jgi:hypothetical protein
LALAQMFLNKRIIIIIIITRQNFGEKLSIAAP